MIRTDKAIQPPLFDRTKIEELYSIATSVIPCQFVPSYPYFFDI